MISFITAFLSLELIYISLDTYYFKPEKFKNVPPSIEIDQINVTMTAGLYRDFCTNTDERNHTLKCAILLTSNISISAGFRFWTEIHINKIWAIGSKSIWYASPSQIEQINSNLELLFFNGDKVRWLLQNGPDNVLWQEGDFVDVIVQFHYRSNLFYLKSSDIPIVFTEICRE